MCVFPKKKKRKRKRKAVETLLHLLPEHRRQHTALQREPRLPHVWEFKLHWSLPTTPEYRCWWKPRSSSATWINSVKTESFGSRIKVYLILLPFDFRARLPLRLVLKTSFIISSRNLTITAVDMISALYSDEKLQLKWNEIWAHLYSSTSQRHTHTHSHTWITNNYLC